MFFVSQYQILFFSHFPSLIFPGCLLVVLESKQEHSWFLNYKTDCELSKYKQPELESTKKTQLKRNISLESSTRNTCSQLCQLSFLGASSLGYLVMSSGIKNSGLMLDGDM